MSFSPKDDDREPASPASDDLPFPSSLCHRCTAHRYIRSGRGSVFILCPLLPQKYPRQPVIACPLFQAAPEESGT